MKKFVKTVGTYIIAGAATAIGWKTVEALDNPYNRALLKQKFTAIKSKLVK